MTSMAKVLVISLVILSLTMCAGCIDNDEYDVTINVLYSTPYHINNTTVYLEGDQFLQFKNVTLEIFPPFLGDRTITMEKDDYEIMVVDTNFNLIETGRIKIKSRTYVDIIISNDTIDIDQSDKQTEYK
jgi:hypothetical protein